MKNKVIIAFAMVVGSLHAAEIETAPYDGSWESLQAMPVPAWFDDGKIGIFIHWGPYSAIGYRKGGRGYSEHVPKMIYRDAKHYYPYLKERWGAHPPSLATRTSSRNSRRELGSGSMGQPVQGGGCNYVVLTAEHHDGWANWDSELTPWNAVDKGPKRDLVGDLGKACSQTGAQVCALVSPRAPHRIFCQGSVRRP